MRLRVASTSLTATLTLVAIAGGQSPAAVGTDEWPQWLGPGRDGVWRAAGVVTSLEETAPRVLWRSPVDAGFSGPCVAGGRVYVTDFVRKTGTISNRASAAEPVTGEERVLCFDAESGEERWVHRYQTRYSVSYPSGPRTTPLIHNGRVYTLGTDGHLLCLSAESGEIHWSKHFPTDYAAKTPFWGHSAHPLRFEDTLVCLVGAEEAVVVAFDLEDGSERWRALKASEPGYAPASMATLSGNPTLLVWHPESLNALVPSTGTLLWSLPITARSGMSVNAPLAVGQEIYVSGIGTKPTLVRVSDEGDRASVVWRGGPRKGITTSNSPPLVHDGILYGVDTQGRLIASSFETGEQLWSTYKATTGGRGQQYFTAFLVRHDEHFFLFNERGELVLAELSQDGFSELGRTKLIEPTTDTYGRTVLWSHPAFSGRSVFVRNDRELIRVSLAER